MATVTVDVDVPDEGGLIRVQVNESNVWRLMLNGTTVPQRKTEEWVRCWRRRAQQGGVVGYLPNRTRQYMEAGLGPLPFRVIKDTYSPSRGGREPGLVY